MLQRFAQEPARRRPGIGDQILYGAGANDLTPSDASGRTEIENIVGATNGLFVVLHDDQRVAIARECRQRIQQNFIVARMQPDRRLIEYVTDALQIRPELRGEADSLRFTSG